MPTIIKDEKQTKALNDINAYLAEIKSINTMLDDTKAKFRITYTPARGKGITVDVDSTFTSRLQSALRQQKGKRARAAQLLAQKYRIELDEDELAIMADKPFVGDSEGDTDDSFEESDLDSSEPHSPTGYSY